LAPFEAAELRRRERRDRDEPDRHEHGDYIARTTDSDAT
jgi:hypothetical protein